MWKDERIAEEFAACVDVKVKDARAGYYCTVAHMRTYRCTAVLNVQQHTAQTTATDMKERS